MRILVIQQYHDYNPTAFVVDTAKLNPQNPVDAKVLGAVPRERGFPNQFNAYYNRDENPEFEEPELSRGAVVDDITFPLTDIERIVWLTVAFG